MIDLLWNFPLLKEQQGIWAKYLDRSMKEYAAESVEMQRPSFRTIESILREHAGRLLGFPAERTWITAGGHHGTLNALFASGLVRKRIAVEGNSYPGFLDQCRMTRTDVQPVAFDEHGMQPWALRETCEKLQKTGVPLRGVFTMPTVQNPMGFVTPLDRREAIVAIARQFDLTIIEDDAYGYMEADAPPNYAVLAPERTFYVRGLSKSFSPGTRTGFLVAPEDAQEALVTSFRCTATGTDVPQNLASLLMMEDGTLEQVIAAKRVEGAVRNREARGILAGAAGAGVSLPAGAKNAWHLWVPLPEGVDPQGVVDKMAEKDVLISSGEFCAASAEYGRGVRVALGGELERGRMLEGIGQLVEILAAG